MQDLQTKSLWSQISGVCIQGEMEGAKLTIFPAAHTTFAEYKKNYPEGVLLKKPEKGGQGSYYAGYFEDSTKIGIFGRLESFEQLPAKEKVFGIRAGGQQAAVSVAYLEKNSLCIMAEFNPPIVVTYDPGSLSVSAFQLNQTNSSDPTKLSLLYSKLTTTDGSQSWDARTGKLVTGDGSDLSPVPVVTSFWFAWASFFPETTLTK